MHRILVPAFVTPVAPTGEQNAPGVTTGPPPPPAGAVVFGAAFVVGGFAGGFTDTDVPGTAAAADVTTGDGDGLGEGLGDSDGLGDAASGPVCLAGLASGPQAVSANTAVTATAMTRVEVTDGSFTWSTPEASGAWSAPSPER